MQEDHLKALLACHLFDGMQRSKVENLFSGEQCHLFRYNRGALIAFRGDVYTNLWILVEGRIAAEFQDFSGKVLKVETLKTSEAVASSILFAPENNLPVNLSAETDVVICSIPRPQVIRLLQQEERFLTNFLRDSGLRLTILAEKLRLVQFATITEKIAGYLLEQADTQGTDSPLLPLTKEALAEIFGVTRPSLSREFSQFCTRGILSQTGRQIHILKREKLEAVLEKN
ncbi:MAG: Crp/Fnr family transcriptional regulator [Spirochaetia bacterium]|nr:Crp/Fnr family transcriptional regulator [Spirochaetia bacterium]